MMRDIVMKLQGAGGTREVQPQPYLGTFRC